MVKDSDKDLAVPVVKGGANTLEDLAIKMTNRVVELEGEIKMLTAALRPIALAYPDDPGTSDLYDEQPVSITLGDVRRAWRVLAKL